MANGVEIDIAELVALKRFVAKNHHQPTAVGARSGQYLSTFRGRGMDFAEVRHYQPGDDIRHMEWRVTARTGRPHVKVYQEERERPVVIFNDFNPSMYFGTQVAFKSVRAAQLAAMLAWTAIKQGDRVGGVMASCDQHDEFTPKSREKGILPWLAKLSDYTYRHQAMNTTSNKPRQLSDSLLRLRRVVRPGSMVILISDFYQLDSDSEQHLSFLSMHNQLMAYHVCDPLELAPPKPDIYVMTNGEDDLILDTQSRGVRFDYQAFCDSRHQAVRALCQRTKIQYVMSHVDQDAPTLIRQTFPRRLYV